MAPRVRIPSTPQTPWKGDRVVYRARLESESVLNGTKGSNPFPSAMKHRSLQ